MINEILRKKMGEALENGDSATALELSKELDRQIVVVQKLKNMSAVIIISRGLQVPCTST